MNVICILYNYLKQAKQMLWTKQRTHGKLMVLQFEIMHSISNVKADEVADDQLLGK